MEKKSLEPKAISGSLTIITSQYFHDIKRTRGARLTFCSFFSRYFGRAKELPGVKELFESKKKDEDEDQATAEFYRKFTKNGPAYYGDEDEADGELLQFEKEAELEGLSPLAMSMHINLLVSITVVDSMRD